LRFKNSIIFADMNISFRIIAPSDILIILPLMQEMGSFEVPENVLKERILEMATQSYECIGVYDAEILIGICGLWFQTRHYAGKSVEADHIIIDKAYRNKGLGDQLFSFIYEYATNKKCNWVELNTYVQNFPSHKFYYNQGFVIKGYHFVKEL
jgi:GNAT superfamily N-acetyltransferase|tara:strand:- start:56 stop:514 length:459 start_codon:yes stop_codon:yes gene_type:complete